MKDNIPYVYRFGHPGCHGCQICWGNDPAVQAVIDSVDIEGNIYSSGDIETLPLRAFGVGPDSE